MAAPPVPPDRHLPMPRPAPSTTYYNGPPPGFHPGAFLPGEVGTTYGPTNPAPPPYPGWMSPADLMAEAQREAQAFYGPLLAELHRQQTQLHNHNLAQQAAIQGVFQAIQGGLSGPYAQMAGNEGQLGYLGAVQDANQSEQDLAFKVMQLAQEASGKQGDFLGALQDQQASLAGDYQKAHTPTIHGSLTTGLYATYPDGTIKILRPPSGAGAAPKLSAHMVNGQLVWFDPTTGLPVGDPYGTKTPPKTRALPNLQFRDIAGSLWAVDPRTGRKVRNLGPSGTTAEPNVDLPLSRALHTWVDGGGKPISSLAGIPPPSPPSRAVKPPSASAVRAGWKVVEDSYYHPPGSRRRITQAEIQAKLDGINKGRAAYNQQNKLSPGDTGFRAPITPDAIPAMTAQQRRILGIAGLPRNPQDIYIDLIHAHIPPYRAWQMVRRYFPNFGQGYFPGKAAAAAETAAADYTKWVRVAPGADRPGMSTHPGILAFAAKVAQVHGSPLTVTTGTRHNQYVKGEGRTQSAHWTGWATDILYGHGTGPDNIDPALTRLGQDALIAAGMPEAQARKITSWSGGDYNGYNILFNTNVGGNHYNHLHIGLKPSRQRDPSTRNLAGSQSPTSPQGARQVAFSLAESKYHWNKSEQSALDQLWEDESGWDYLIHNKEGSGAVGIPQRMPSSHPITDDYLTNPLTQIKWGLNYIKTRYRTPSRARAFWLATVNKNAATAPSDLRRTAQIWIRKGWAGY